MVRDEHLETKQIQVCVRFYIDSFSKH